MNENASNIKTQNLLWVRMNYLVHETQVYLLAAPASSTTLTIFRTHLGLLNGAVLALLFPVTDAYKLPGEVWGIYDGFNGSLSS